MARTADAADQRLIAKAVDLGHRALGQAWPNPAVGCVIAHFDEIAGEGWTGPGGRPHAEEVALQHAGARARGATAYVTLEPCAVRSAGTASCSELLVLAGVTRVVIACEDPTPNAAGRGIERLRGAGIQVDVGLGAEKAAVLSAGFEHRVRTGLPLVEPSADGHGFDARFEPEPGETVEAALRRYGDAGYTRLWTHDPTLPTGVMAMFRTS